MIDFNGITKGVIGRKLPADSTLKNMKKSELINYLHVAEHNYNAVVGWYINAVRENKCNECLLPEKLKEMEKKCASDGLNDNRQEYSGE